MQAGDEGNGISPCVPSQIFRVVQKYMFDRWKAINQIMTVGGGWVSYIWI